MIGSTISHYRILEKLGEGGMGIVYKAQDTKLDRTVVLKFLPPHLSAGEKGKQRFINEAKAASALNQPNICTIHEIDETPGGQLFIVMTLYDGVPLARKIEQAPLRIEDALDVAIQVSEGLQVAHERGIVHRDIKSSNIMVTEKGRAVIMDFGLAQTTGTTKLTKSGATVGTVPYMSPEQARGEKVDHRTDVWSLGVVLYEMITGQLPFKSEYHEAIVYSILNQIPRPVTGLRTGVPMELEQVVNKCLEKKASDRYQHTDDLIVDLRKVSHKTGIQPPMPRKHLKAIWAGLPIVLLALIATYILWPLGEGNSRTESLAVLPLANLSGGPEQEYFADGMTEELISRLSRIQNLQVVARTSVVRFKGTQKDIKEIGKELGVRYVLEGSVRKADNRVRITAQLIDGETGFHLWSEDFNGELQDVFAVQESTALKITEALNLRLSPKEVRAVRQRYTENVQAYDAYLRGWALLESWNLGIDRPEKLKAARKHFELALSIDSSYALAFAGLSIAESYIYWIGRGPRKHLERGERLARKALALDPQLSEAHAALGDAYGLAEDWARAIDEYRQAIRLDRRNFYAWEELAWALNFKNQPEPREAEQAAREAVRLQPGWVWGHYQLGNALRLQKAYAEAIAAFQQALHINPTFRDGIVGLGIVYLERGEYNQALGQFSEARRMQETPNVLIFVSAANAGLGDKEMALTNLEKALARGYRNFAAIDTSVYFQSLRDDPRFQALMRRMRFSE